MISSTSSRSGAGSAKARAPATSERNRSRRAASRLATAWIGQPAGSGRRPSAVPTAPAPTIPMSGGSPGAEWTCGWAWSLGVSLAVGRGGGEPGGGGSRSIPAASMARRCVSAPVRVVAPRIVAGERRAQAFIGAPTARPDRRGRFARVECSEPRGWTRCHGPDPFGARASLGAGLPDYYRLAALGDRIDLDHAPVTLKILLENVLRHAGGGIVRAEDVETLARLAARLRRPRPRSRSCRPGSSSRTSPACPAVVDLAVMRDAMADLGGDPARVNPLVPADLVIDHSVQVDQFGTPGAFAFNVEREYERNGERYQLLRWAQTAFRDLRVVPPGTGIVHQVNLEYLATVVDRPRGRRTAAASPSRTRSSGPTRTRR